MQAELAYLFRHALLREAAHQLQLPSARRRLHAIAFELIEAVAGGPPPAAPPLTGYDQTAPPAHASDPFAEELAAHAREAGLAEGREYARRAAAYADRMFRPDAAVRLWLAHAALSAGSERADSTRRAAMSAYVSGRPREAEPLFARAEALFREASDERGRAISLGSRGLAVGDLGRREEGLKMLEEATAMHREHGDLGALATGLSNTGNNLRRLGRLAEAERAFEKALALHRAAGNRRGEGVVLVNLANVLDDEGRRGEAETLYRRSLEIHRAHGNLRAEGITLGNLSLILEDTDRAGGAERGFRESLRILREAGERWHVGVFLGNLASLLSDQRRFAESDATFEEALAIHREVGNRRSEAIALGNQAHLRVRCGRLEEADGLYAESLRLIGSLDAGAGAVLRCGLARLRVLQGRTDEARLEWSAAMDGLRRAGASPGRIEAQRAEMKGACEQAGVPFATLV